MKKIIAFLVLVVIVIALLPIVGNKLVEGELSNRVEVLVSYGVEVSQSSTESSYLNTKKHYEFVVEDTEKFMQYLSQFADAQLPPYIDAMVDGIRIGVDVEYSNFPISDGIFLDIYPLTLSKNMMQNLKKEDINFYTYIENLLQNRGVLYHLNYNVVNSGFKGYIKDIKEEYVLKEKTKITLELLDASFEGNGVLVAPDRLSSRVGTIKFTVTNENEKFNVELKEFTSSSTFESQSTYASGAKLQSMEFVITGTGTKDAKLKLDELHVNASANTQGETAEYNLKTSFKALDIVAKTSTFQAADFNYDISLSGVDKKSVEELRVLFSQAKVSLSPDLEEKIQKSVVNIISKGLTFFIADFSLAQVGLDNVPMVKGFNLKSKLDIKADADLAQKLQNAPLLLVQNIDLDATFKFSKALFALLNKKAPLSSIANNYAKEEGEDFVFDIKFVQGELTVNDKVLQ